MEMKGKSWGSSLLVPSVQELAKEPLTKVPIRYIQDLSPISGPDLLSQVPVIDMQRLLSTDLPNHELEKLHFACKDWGFFQMINHGVSCLLIEKLEEEIQGFFNLPMKEKQKFWQEESDLEGFGQAFVLSEEQKLDWADMFYLVTLPHHLRKPNLLPKLPHRLRDALEEYSREVKNISMQTLIFIAKAVGMEVKDMKAVFDEGMQTMRMNYYPPCPQPEQVIGLTAHSDPNGITFLLQINQVDGLQIKKDGTWMHVKPLPNAFIVNVGDTLEIVTNGIYKSMEHRALVNSKKERLSIATFISPNMDGDFGPAPSLITSDTPPRFTRVSAVDFHKNFLSRKLKRKSNIEQYRI